MASSRQSAAASSLALLLEGYTQVEEGLRRSRIEPKACRKQSMAASI